MSSQKVVGVMGSGLVGTDPYAPNAWSGSSKYFFTECSRQGLLHRAFGVEVGKLPRAALMLSNFSRDRAVWRQDFYLDTRYYDLLSKRIVAQLQPEEEGYGIVQIGGMYHLRPLLAKHRPIFSYHDGNLAQALRSPQFTQGVSSRRIRQALDYERRVYAGIDIIFTMSEYLRQSFISDFGVDAARVKTVGAGMNLDSIPAEAPAKTYDGRRLLFMGADFERKGGMDLLLAFRKVRSVFPDARLDIVGPRNLDIPAGLADGVVYSGFLSRQDPAQAGKLAELLRAATLFVMPSRYEPFGIAPLEAMAHQIPAVLTDSWAFPEMVVPGVNGELVKTNDPGDLAEKIVSLLKDPDRLREMGHAGRARVLSRYTWEAVVRRMREAIEASQSSPVARRL